MSVTPADTSPPLTVYGKPGCVQCDATYRALDQAGVNYSVVDIATDEIARQWVMSLGHMQAPVVVADDGQSWSGFRPDKINAYAASLTVAPDQHTAQVSSDSVALAVGGSTVSRVHHVDVGDGSRQAALARQAQAFAARAGEPTPTPLPSVGPVVAGPQRS